MSGNICVYQDFLSDAHRAQIERTAAKGGMRAAFFTSDLLDEAMAFVPEAEVLYASAPKLLKAGKALRWYCCSTAGVDIYCQNPSLFPNDTCVLTNSNVYGLTVAEHTLMVTLMLLRRQPEYTRRVAERRWEGGLPIRSIHGSRPLLLGTGQICRCIAERFRALGAERIVGVSRSGRPAEGFDEVHPIGELDSLLPGTDLLIMAVPGTGETYHLLNRERLALLPDTAYVVNVGRGTAVDQAALAEALEAGVIAGAALDVAEHEPPAPDDPLWSVKNLLLTPHVAGTLTLAYTRDMNVDSFCEDLENYIAGRPLAHAVDRSRGY